MLLLRPIFGHALRLAVLRYELRWLHVVRIPIKVENLFLRPEEIFWVSMTLETPCHAVRFGNGHGRHVIHIAVATEAANPAIHMCAVIVKNVIRDRKSVV